MALFLKNKLFPVNIDFNIFFKRQLRNKLNILSSGILCTTA